MRGTLSYLSTGLIAAGLASAFRVPIADTDSLREVCSGMWAGKDTNIELAFDPKSAGQVALVIYEWDDVGYLGAETDTTGTQPKTYICTTSAVRLGLCTTQQLGSFITHLPTDTSLDSTSIFTQALKFSIEDTTETETDDQKIESEEGGDRFGFIGDDGEASSTPAGYNPDKTIDSEIQDTRSNGQIETSEVNVEDYMPLAAAEEMAAADAEYNAATSVEEISDPLKKRLRVKRQEWGDNVDEVTGGQDDQEGQNDQPQDGEDWQEPSRPEDATDTEEQPDQPDQQEPPVEQLPPADNPPVDSSPAMGATYYTQPIIYPVRKTGYYCVGIVPVTLVESRGFEEKRETATHAEYAGIVTFHNVFEGELPAVEYPKINFYLILSIVYFVLGCGWAFLCVKHRDELLPMQYYTSGTIAFLIIEMLANFAYYRYINKHGGGTASLAFLFVISALNAARNSLSFFLLLIVSMGLSVVRQSLGSVMNKIRILTAFHFIFGVLYSVGTVEVELESASLILIMILIFPLALTLTAFLMWIIVSLNGTIMFLQANKQRMKLQMFQRLWRILIMAVIAIAAFFVISSMSLSNRLDEDYAPKNWKYRWFLLDGSLALIYLAVFSAVAYIWRPTANNRSFSMSQELAQDEAEADAEDYEFSNLEEGRRAGHQPSGQEDEFDHINGDGRGDSDDEDDRKKYGRGGGRRGEVEDENTVFALDDSDDEGSDEGTIKKGKRSDEYRDNDRDSDEDDDGGKRR